MKNVGWLGGSAAAKALADKWVVGWLGDKRTTTVSR